MNNRRLQRPYGVGYTPAPRGPVSASHPPPGNTSTGHTAPTVESFVEGEALFLASLPVIDDVTGQVCRRHHLSATESDDFRSDVRLHFIQGDYEVLRRFEKRCSLSTYVNVVVQRLLLDFRNRQWGRWRPSAEAKRQGPPAILLERLVSRDGWTFEQVAETLRVNHGIVVDEPLRKFHEHACARRPRPVLVAEEEAADLESGAPGADANVVRAEHGFLANRVRMALVRAQQMLAPEERLILKMRFEDAVPVADIARGLHLDQKRLYRTIERLLARIAASLEAEGISRSDATALFELGALSWDFAQGSDPPTDVKPAARPAEPVRPSWPRKR
jgi:RNA polymerase sigma factor (sigma-70 family)